MDRDEKQIKCEIISVPKLLVGVFVITFSILKENASVNFASKSFFRYQKQKLSK
jgi:hypothetical protein